MRPPGVSAETSPALQTSAINVTLFFSQTFYEQVVEAYLAGLETFVASNGDLDERIARQPVVAVQRTCGGKKHKRVSLVLPISSSDLLAAQGYLCGRVHPFISALAIIGFRLPLPSTSVCIETVPVSWARNSSPPRVVQKDTSVEEQPVTN